MIIFSKDRFLAELQSFKFRMQHLKKNVYSSPLDLNAVVIFNNILIFLNPLRTKVFEIPLESEGGGFYSTSLKHIVSG